MDWEADLDAVLIGVYLRIEWRCQQMARDNKQACETLRRSLGQHFRHIQERASHEQRRND